MVTVTICGMRAATGKTTTAVNLAAELAAMGVRVGLQDLDPRGPATAALGHAVVQDPWNAEAVDVPHGESGIGCLRLGRAGRPLAGARGHDVRVLLGRWRDHADVLIIDTPPGAAAVTTAAVEAADLMLTTVDRQGGPADVRNASQIRWMLSGPATALRAVLVRVPPHGLADLRNRIADSYPSALMQSEIPEAPPTLDCAAFPLFRLCTADTTMVDAYRRLTRELLNDLRAGTASVAA